eukprot:scaffold29325_cov127-Isochrysis_galbana.AAC.4
MPPSVAMQGCVPNHTLTKIQICRPEIPDPSFSGCIQKVCHCHRNSNSLDLSFKFQRGFPVSAAAVGAAVLGDAGGAAGVHAKRGEATADDVAQVTDWCRRHAPVLEHLHRQQEKHLARAHPRQGRREAAHHRVGAITPSRQTVQGSLHDG